MSRLKSILTGDTSPRKRIGLTVAATGFGRLVGVAYNFFLVPVLLSAWGVQIYGEWVVLSALASMASLSNVGFVQASLSEMILRVSAGEREEAQRVLSTTLVGLLGLVVVVFAIGLTFIYSVESTTLFGVRSISLGDAKLVVALALASVLAGFFPGALNAPVSAVAGAGISQGVMTFAKLGELVAIIALALAGGGPVAVTAVPVVSALVTCAVFLVLTRKLVPWLKLSLFAFDRATFRRLLHPSLAQFLLFASVNIVAIQLPRILISSIAGAAAVAGYSVAVTYCRSARMLTGVIAQSFLVELSRAYSERKVALTAKLVESICQLGLWVTIVVAVAMLAVAPPLFHIWTHGRILPDIVLLGLLFGGAVIGALSEGYTYLLMGINRVWPIAVVHLICCAVGLGVGFAAYPVAGVHGVALGLLLPELSLVVVGLYGVSQSLDLSRKRMLLASLSPPVRMIRLEIQHIVAKFARGTAKTG